MSDWKTTELFIERTNSAHSAFAVGVAIAFLGNRKEGGWTHASPERIAKLARLDDHGTVNLAIRELERLGELEYERGTSRFRYSQYRIRVEALRDRLDRYRCPLTNGKNREVTTGNNHPVGWPDGRESPASPPGVSDLDHRAFPDSPPGKAARSIDTDSDIRSLDQSLIRDDASKDAGVDQTQDDDGAMRAALAACRRVTDRRAAE